MLVEHIARVNVTLRMNSMDWIEHDSELTIQCNHK